MHYALRQVLDWHSSPLKDKWRLVKLPSPSLKVQQHNYSITFLFLSIHIILSDFDFYFMPLFADDSGWPWHYGACPRPWSFFFFFLTCLSRFIATVKKAWITTLWSFNFLKVNHKSSPHFSRAAVVINWTRKKENPPWSLVEWLHCW